MTRYQKGALLGRTGRRRQRRKGEFLSLFLRVVDIRTRIQRLVEGVGDTNEVREGEEDTENLVQEERQGDGVQGSGKPEQTRERGKKSEIEKRLWLWTTDYQRGLAYGLNHWCDLVGRTNPLVHQVRKTHLRETIPPRRLGVVKLSHYRIALSWGTDGSPHGFGYQHSGTATLLLSREKIILVLSILIFNLIFI